LTATIRYTTTKLPTRCENKHLDRAYGWIQAGGLRRILLDCRRLKHLAANVGDTAIGHTQRTSGGKRKVKHAAADVWAAIVYDHHHRSLVRKVRHANFRAEG
jgi:hypothetical protein